MVESVQMAKVRAAESACASAAAACRNPDQIPATEAVRLYEKLDGAIRVLGAAKTLLAKRVKDSQEWKSAGHSSAAEHLASLSGRSLGAARSELETSEALDALSATKDALLEGNLSEAQGQVIADAAKANPKAEKRLIHQAKQTNHRGLRDEAAKAKAEADTDPDATHKRIHAERRLSHGRDLDGAWSLHAKGTVTEGALIAAELARLTEEIFATNRTTGVRECRDAYQFDALKEMARRSHRLRTAGTDHPAGDTGDGALTVEEAAAAAVDARKKRRLAAPQHLALLRLDIEALWRGYTQGDELCELTGAGPVPVNEARALLGEAVLKLIITRGVDVLNVTSLTRGPTQAMRYATLWTSPLCRVQGCTKTRIEHDHRWGAEYKDTGHTRLDELDPLCHHHHELHTREGWALLPGTGDRPMVPPDHPRHPANAPPPPGDDMSKRAPAPGGRASPDRDPPNEQGGLFADPAA